jgi:hypothetical protein
MIYVTENNFERQLALLDSVTRMCGETNLIAWLYQESEAKSVAGLVVSSEPQGFLPVTTYGDGSEQGLNTEPKEFSPSLISELLKRQTQVIDSCDSLAIYKPGKNEWCACVIHDEDMCLVSDDSLLEKLKEQRFIATTEAPSWW